MRDDLESGATMVEYGLILLGIAIAATLAVAAFGGRLTTLYQSFVDLF